MAVTDAGLAFQDERRAMHDEKPNLRSADQLVDVERIFREHAPFVWRTLQHLGVAVAQLDDALQDVFVVVHRRIGDYDGRASLRSWLYGVARRVASDYRRGTRAGTRRLWVVGSDRPAACEQGRTEAAQIVAQVLAKLDEDKRMVFVLSEIEGMTAPEIGVTLGLNVNTVYARLRAARQRIERELAESAPAKRKQESWNAGAPISVTPWRRTPRASTRSHVGSIVAGRPSSSASQKNPTSTCRQRLRPTAP
jgi:RNA polymerase sigma-70 factor (ECF subfamily)